MVLFREELKDHLYTLLDCDLILVSLCVSTVSTGKRKSSAVAL